MRVRGLWIAFFCLGMVGQLAAQVSPQPRGELAFDTPTIGRLELHEAHLYTLDVAPDTLITLELEARDTYALLLDEAEQITEPQAQIATDILARYVYLTGQARRYTLWLEGTGDYVITLRHDDQLREPQATLRLGDTVDGQLDIDQTDLFELNIPDNTVIALTLAQPRALIAAEIRADTGAIMTPVLTRTIDRDTQMLVYTLGDASPYTLNLRGSGRYSITLADGETLAGKAASLKFNEPLTGEAPLTGIVPYTFTTDAATVSLAIQAPNVQLTLSDASQQPIFARTTYFDDAAQARVYVFRLTGQRAAYTLHLFITTDYTLTLSEEDTSERNLGTLQANRVTSSTLSSGLTPRYTLDTKKDATLIFNLFYNALALSAPLEVTLTSSDNILTRAEAITPVTNNHVRFMLQPQGESPYTLALGITGAHVLSVVSDTAPRGIRIQLIEDEVNLRSGSTITDPILREGTLNEEMIAIQQSPDERWLLALTEDHLAVWVFRSLTTPVNARDSLSDLPMLTPSPTLTAEPTETPVASPTPTVTPTSTPLAIGATTQAATASETGTSTSVTEATTIASATPVSSRPVICEMESEGGVNLRRGPGTNHPIIGSLTQGTKLGIVGQYTDAEGNVWWQLVTDAWVRADVVLETGDCNTAPVIKIN